jgi:hypothetical protein
VATKTLAEILQHIDVAMNISETTVPKAEVVTAFNSEPTNPFLVTKRGTGEETNTSTAHLGLLLQKSQDHSNHSSGILCQEENLPKSSLTIAVLCELHEVLEITDFDEDVHLIVYIA